MKSFKLDSETGDSGTGDSLPLSQNRHCKMQCMPVVLKWGYSYPSGYFGVSLYRGRPTPEEDEKARQKKIKKMEKWLKCRLNLTTMRKMNNH